LLLLLVFHHLFSKAGFLHSILLLVIVISCGDIKVAYVVQCNTGQRPPAPSVSIGVNQILTELSV